MNQPGSIQGARAGSDLAHPGVLRGAGFCDGV
jgi:hypothetical protein